MNSLIATTVVLFTSFKVHWIMKISDIAKELGVSQKRAEKLLASELQLSDEQSGKLSTDGVSISSLRNSLLRSKESESERVKESKSVSTARQTEWIDISDKWTSPQNHKFTCADLFCGAGGMALGFEMAGFKTVAGTDWYEPAKNTYEENFTAPFIYGDIREEGIKQEFVQKIQKQTKSLTVLSGGFPCQGFSMAGNRVVTDPRNSLYKEMLEIVDRLSPEFVVMENVKGLRSMLKGRVERQIISDLQKLGYDVQVETLVASNYEVPQKRERVIFIGRRKGRPIFHPAPLLSEAEWITSGEAIGDLMSAPENSLHNHTFTRHRADMVERIKLVPEGSSLYKNYSDSWKRIEWNKASCTIKENHGGVNIHPKLNRVMTPRELARLQSFPDHFKFSGSKNKQLVQIGNAVPPLLAKAIGLAIIQALESK